MADGVEQIYIALISVHGLIRADNLELGRDADTGGQTLYVLELAQALSELPNVCQVDLVTRRVIDSHVDAEYAEPIEKVNDKFRIVRIDAGPEEYIYKEHLWDHLDGFADNLADFFRKQDHVPDLIHSHYADAGLVGSHVANLLGIPLVHTGHSLGRVCKLVRQLLKQLTFKFISFWRLELLNVCTRRNDTHLIRLIVIINFVLFFDFLMGTGNDTFGGR